MKTETKKELGIIVLLVLVVLVMTVGFAAFSQTLNITGNLTVNPATWNVHFVNNNYTETTNSVVASTHNITNTDFTFTVTLDKPGDFYETTIQVKNDGSFDAELTKITMSTLTAAQSKYLTYTIDYNGTTYSSTTSLSSAVALAAGSTATVKVRLEYVLPTDSADLPSTQQSITISGNLDYAQKQ